MTRRRTHLGLNRWFERFIAAGVIVAAASLQAWAALPSGNVVQQWNKIAEDVVVGSAHSRTRD